MGKGAVNNKNNSFWARAYFFRGKEQEWFFVLQIAPSGKWGGVGGAYMTAYLAGAWSENSRLVGLNYIFGRG